MSEAICYIDCHTHILPGMDDGPKTVTESVEMLKYLSLQGVSSAWLTPHFYPWKETQHNFLNRREKSYALLKPYAGQIGIELFPASETYLSNYLQNYTDLSELCIGGKYLLTELPYSADFSQQTFGKVARLIEVYGITPILAHIERYPELMKDGALLKKLVAMGCLTQINLGSLKKGIRKRKLLSKYMQSDLVHLVGTDCHDMSHRLPAYDCGASMIKERIGIGYLQKFMSQAKQITDESTQTSTVEGS
jgi:protein-tyrosine phosphatase